MDTLDYLSDRLDKTSDSIFLTDLLKNEDIKSRLEMINSEIDIHLGKDGEPKILYETAKHLLKAGGKRLRSLLVVLCCEAVGGDITKAVPFSVAIELAQTASLIHDDVIDEDTLRRGVRSTHEQFGHKMAILAGDLLVAQAVKMIGSLGTPEIIVQIAEEGIRMCEGEAADILLNADNPNAMTIENYLEMIQKKTVSFIKAATSVGASIGKGTKEQISSLRRYGENLGFAFQIRDDVLNIISSSDISGKDEYSDLLSKRCTFPLVHALDKSSPEDRERCLQALSEGDMSVALHLVERTRAIPASIEKTTEYIRKAKATLKEHDFVNAHLLEQVADFVLQRLH